MANTNRPTTSTHQQVIVPPNGDAVLGADTIRLRYFNNYPIVEKQIGQDPKYYVKRRPPVENTNISFATTPVPNSISSIYYDPVYEATWFVNFRTVVRVGEDTTNYNAEDFNRLTESTIPAARPDSSIEGYLVADTQYICVLEQAAGQFGKVHYYFPGTPPTVSSSTTLNFSAKGKLVFLDGYLFVAGNNQRIYNSTLGTPTEWLEGASFIDAEMGSDPLLSVARHRNHIVAFGRDSIEFFYNASIEVGSPLQRQVAYGSREVGLHNTSAIGTLFDGTQPDDSFVDIGDTLYFLGAKNSTLLGLYKIENFKISKVSDYSLDFRLRKMPYIKISSFDLNGEMCVLIMDQSGVALPMIFIPSMGITVEFDWGFIPTHSIAVGGRGTSNVSLLFHTQTATTSYLYSSGTYQFLNFLSLQAETFASQYAVDYLDFNNNAHKHWKYVDVMGSFGTNQVAIGYRNDNYGYNNGEFINLPYISASAAGPRGNLRFRNLGHSRRQGYTVFVNGPDDYLYKGVAVGYNQWGE